MKKLNDFFKIRKNAIYERARFNRRVQWADESVKHFITNLYRLVKHCGYRELKKEMVRDRIVVRIRDSALSERLQLDSELILEKAKKLVWQKEAVHEHQQFLSSKSSEVLRAVVDAMTKGNSKQRSCRGRQNRSLSRPPTQQSQPANQQVCTRCGKGVHSRGTCPTREAVYHKCNKKGHYSAICRTKAVAAVPGEPLETAYLDTVERDSSSHQPWICHIKVNDIVTAFKIDTGAEVTAISEETYGLLNSELSKPSKALQGPDRKAQTGSHSVHLGVSQYHLIMETDTPLKKCMLSKD